MQRVDGKENGVIGEEECAREKEGGVRPMLAYCLQPVLRQRCLLSYSSQVSFPGQVWGDSSRGHS